MKKLMFIMLTLSICVLLPNCCGLFSKKCSRKTTKVVEKEIEINALEVTSKNAKEPAEIKEFAELE